MTWVPPAQRPNGGARPGEGGQEPGTGGRLVLPVVGAAATVAAVVGAVVLTGVVSWLDSVCGDTPAVVAAHRGALRSHLVVVWLLAAAVPSTVAAVARTRNRTFVPWVGAAAVVVGVGLGVALTAQPSTWCLF